MKGAVFEIKQNAVGRYYFIFRDTTGKELIVSKSFQDRSSLEICVAQVRYGARVAEVTEVLGDKACPPLFLIEREKTGYVFSLIGFKGEVIFSSDRYSQKDECIKSIELLKNLSLDARIVDSVKEQKESKPTPSSTPVSSESKEQKSAAWPKEFSDWGIPTIKNAKVTASDNRSASGSTVTKGINVVVNLRDVSKADFETYCKELESKGYNKSPNSMAEVLEVYKKSVSGGVIKMTLSYTKDSTTIVANNSAAAAAKETADAGKVQWPQSLKGAPEFTKGKYKETVEMGGGMYAISFTGVTQADLDWYRNTLTKAGFEKNKDNRDEMYVKREGKTTYGVGLVVSGSNLQIMAVSGTD